MVESEILQQWKAKICDRIMRRTRGIGSICVMTRSHLVVPLPNRDR